ncbi:hypothetical protein CPB84DRAFT_1687174 [Gymnopilus junonius]|uniref:Uncharacterized protein n=1 Tax=Gymnopilus junonius TaxID=109634 RepID=A0A9P5NC85_GYMJU|nr:hypothetical protein CPB84DRAFT_1687174 [Gymnopilus junonius]
MSIIYFLGFTDAYYHRLTGKQAAWANKKYCGHCCMPETLMADMENDNMK